MRNSSSRKTLKQNAFTIYDVSDRVKAWGRRGLLSGGVVGTTFGVAFTAYSHGDKVLAFGVAGTLLVAAVEGAVIGGAFAACAAALYSKDAHRCRTTRADLRLPPDRRIAVAGRGDATPHQSGWLTEWTTPVSLVESVLPETSQEPNTLHPTETSDDPRMQ